MDRAAGEPDIRALVGRLEAAWNAADGPAFAAPFAEDADFTVFDGKRLRGRDEIAKDHAHAFATGNRDTTARFAVERLRFLGPDVAVAHLDVLVTKTHWTLVAPRERPAGPVAVLHRTADGWQIVAFANVVWHLVPAAHHPDNR